MKSPKSVAEEIGQKVPFSSPSQEVVVGLLRTADDVRRFLGGVLGEAGVTLQQYNVLRILRGAGEEGLPTLEIGRRMIEQQPGVTRLVDRLIAKGWVERTRGVQDRRKVVCAITTEGLALLGSLDPAMSAVDGEVKAALNDRELKAMIQMMNALRAELRESQ